MRNQQTRQQENAVVAFLARITLLCEIGMLYSGPVLPFEEHHRYALSRLVELVEQAGGQKAVVRRMNALRSDLETPLNQSTLSRLLAGDSKMTFDYFFWICAALGVEPADICGRGNTTEELWWLRIFREFSDDDRRLATRVISGLRLTEASQHPPSSLVQT